MSSRLEDTWAPMLLPGSSISLWEDQAAPPPPQWSCVNYVPTDTDSWDIGTLQRMHQTCHVPTLIEEYRMCPPPECVQLSASHMLLVTTQMFGASTIKYNDEDSPYGKSPFDDDVLRSAPIANASLSALESALANATAMTMWSAARAGTLTTSTNVTPYEDEIGRNGRREYVTDPNTMVYSTHLEPASGSASVTEQALVGRISVRNMFLDVYHSRS